MTWWQLNRRTYTFEVAARDAAGTLDPTPASVTFTVEPRCISGGGCSWPP